VLVVIMFIACTRVSVMFNKNDLFVTVRAITAVAFTARWWAFVLFYKWSILPLFYKGSILPLFYKGCRLLINKWAILPLISERNERTIFVFCGILHSFTVWAKHYRVFLSFNFDFLPALFDFFLERINLLWSRWLINNTVTTMTFWATNRSTRWLNYDNVFFTLFHKKY
jgi:hypothetical protein